MSSTTKRHTEAEWLQHKSRIQQMIVQDGESLEETRKWLAEVNFSVTKAQLEYKLKTWGIRKKVPKNQSNAAWQYIGHQVAKRKCEGKTSEVVLDGQLLNPGKVRKEVNRHQPSTLVKYTQPPSSPGIPQGMDISIRTPASLQTQVPWPANLPWLQFQSHLPYLFDFRRVQSGTAYSPIPLAMDLLGLRRNPAHPTTSLVAAKLESFMPEVDGEQHSGRAQLLLEGSVSEALPEYVKAMLYQLSNDMNHMSWKSVLDLIEQSGITKTPLPAFGKSTDITTKAITEKLFQKAVLHSCRGPDTSASRSLFTWLLSCDVSPDTPVHVSYTGLRTPLFWAEKYGRSDISRQLLDAGASPLDKEEHFKDLVGGQHVVGDNSEETLRLLLTAGVSLWENPDQESALMTAIQSSHRLSFIKCLVEHGANILYQPSPDITRMPSSMQPFYAPWSVLGYAARRGDIEILRYLLDEARRRHPGVSPADFITVDVVLYAAFERDTNILQLLHSNNPTIATAEHNGITALHVAACQGHYEVCEWLLEHGAIADGPELADDMPPSPLHMAAHVGEVMAVHVLHQHGAAVDQTVVFKAGGNWHEDDWVWEDRPIEDAIRSNENIYLCKYLIKHGAKPPALILWYAAVHKDLELLNMGLAAGADPNLDGKRWGNEIQSPLQAALRSKHTGHTTPPDDTMVCTKIASVLLEAGAVLKGGEAQLAICHQDWNLVERILDFDTDHFTAAQPGEMSMLEAVSLTGRLDLVHKVLARTSYSYDPAALCASVLVAAKHGCTAIVEDLILIRPWYTKASLLEGLAIVIAAIYGQLELLNTLLDKLPIQAASIVPWIDDEVPLETIEGQSDMGHVIQSLYDEFNWNPPFWRNKLSTMVASPLAFSLDSRESLSRLLEHGYRPDKLTLSRAVLRRDLGILKSLVGLGRQPDNGEQVIVPGPLSLAVGCRRSDMVQVLLDAGHDINEDNQHVYFGRTPLQYAVEQEDLPLIDLFLEAGANVNAPAATTFGATALQFAAMAGLLGIAKRLVDLNADVDAPGAMNRGRTALEGAAEHGRIDMIQYLLSQGAQTTGAYRAQYLRAVSYAEEEGHMVAADLLKGHREWTADDEALRAKLKLMRFMDREVYRE